MHDNAHWFALQIGAPFADVGHGEHELPHVTSLFATHVEPQRRKPELQVKSHAPSAPQLAVAFAGGLHDRHAPRHAVKPELHSDEHAPLTHVATPFAGAEQGVHELPQLVGCVSETQRWPHAC